MKQMFRLPWQVEQKNLIGKYASVVGNGKDVSYLMTNEVNICPIHTCITGLRM